MKKSATILLVGTLDITVAIVHFKLNGGDHPIRILYFIASGVFGNKAFRARYGNTFRRHGDLI